MQPDYLHSLLFSAKNLGSFDHKNPIFFVFPDLKLILYQGRILLLRLLFLIYSLILWSQQILQWHFGSTSRFNFLTWLTLFRPLVYSTILLTTWIHRLSSLLLSVGRFNFLSAILLSRFSVKISRFFAYFVLIMQCTVSICIMLCVLPVWNLNLRLHGCRFSSGYRYPWYYISSV